MDKKKFKNNNYQEEAARENERLITKEKEREKETGESTRAVFRKNEMSSLVWKICNWICKK